MNKAKRIIALTEQGMGKPRTDAERKARHKAKFGTDKLPPRGTGRRMGHGGRGEDENKVLERNIKVGDYVNIVPHEQGGGLSPHANKFGTVVSIDGNKAKVKLEKGEGEITISTSVLFPFGD